MDLDLLWIRPSQFVSDHVGGEDAHEKEQCVAVLVVVDIQEAEISRGADKKR